MQTTCHYLGFILSGLGFLAFELLLTHGPPTAWLKSGFKANPKLHLDQIDECIRQAKSRLVGSLHLLIQVRCFHQYGPISWYYLSGSI